MRAGSALLSLLLLVHLGAGLLHPCCLGGPVDATAADMVDGALDMGAGHHAMAEGAHTSADATHGEADGHESQHHGGGDDDCDGVCGFCCQSVDDGVVIESPRSFVRVVAPLLDTPPAPQVSEPRAAPDFLLPFANGPPSGSTLLG